MKLKCCFLLLLYYGLMCCQGVNARNDHVIKRGMHPYMAFIYYSDPSITDVSGQRYVRSAVLIRPDWLITTAIGPSLGDPPYGFPKKTLLARAGAITIDASFTLNEDEDEQEREIIQIVRPYNHSATQWWTTDISLMKTLLPFNITSTVDFKALTLNRKNIDSRVCSILVYARKYNNATDEKNLMFLFVDMLPPSINNCGSHFTMNTMACAADSADNSDAVYDADFCQGNSGGPLICDTEVVGLQTYIGNDCKQPHLYQLLSSWEKFITCGIEDKCKEEDCTAICDVVLKDPPENIPITTDTIIQDTPHELTTDTVIQDASDHLTDKTNELSSTTPQDIPDLANLSDLESVTPTTTVMIETFGSSETISKKTDPVLISDVTLTSEEATNATVISVTIDEKPTTNDLNIMKAIQAGKTTKQYEDFLKDWIKQTRTKELKKKYDTESTHTHLIDDDIREHRTFLPPEKDIRDKFYDFEKMERIPNVEAHYLAANEKKKKDKKTAKKKDNKKDNKRGNKKKKSKGNMCVIQTVLIGFSVLLCL